MCQEDPLSLKDFLGVFTNVMRRKTEAQTFAQSHAPR